MLALVAVELQKQRGWFALVWQNSKRQPRYVQEPDCLRLAADLVQRTIYAVEAAITAHHLYRQSCD